MKLYNLPQNIKCIIFDIDSTLYTNEEYAHEQIDVQIRHFAQLRNLTPEQARKMVSNFRREWAQSHNGAKISLGNLFTHFDVSIEDSIEWRKTLIEPADYLTRDEKLITALQYLSKKYYLICVTNNPVLPAEKTLKALGIDSFINFTIGLDTTKKSKPAIEPLELALKKMSEQMNTVVTPKDCISIGDRYDIDLALPLEMGMGGILVDGVEEVWKLSEVL